MGRRAPSHPQHRGGLGSYGLSSHGGAFEGERETIGADPPSREENKASCIFCIFPRNYFSFVVRLWIASMYIGLGSLSLYGPVL